MARAIAMAAREVPRDRAAASARHAARAVRAAGAGDDVFRRLGVGARSCDLGDEGLYLAEELVARRSLARRQRSARRSAILVLALMIAQRQGSTRLPLDPEGPAARRSSREIAARRRHRRSTSPRMVKRDRRAHRRRRGSTR